MPWRGITVAAVVAILGLGGWVYGRDRGAEPAAPSPMIQASLDADEMLNLITSPESCGGRCRATLLDSPSPGIWRIRLSGPAWERCLDLDVSRFGNTDQHGMTGISSTSCATGPRWKTPRSDGDPPASAARGSMAQWRAESRRRPW
jgi:hypothetical protein